MIPPLIVVYKFFQKLVIRNRNSLTIRAGQNRKILIIAFNRFQQHLHKRILNILGFIFFWLSQLISEHTENVYEFLFLMTE
jgi:hypothetical protein